MAWVSTGAISRPRAGEPVSGDCVGIWQEKGKTLATVIDGLGSGKAAAEASQRALACVEANRQQPLTEIMVRCHKALRRTRGVVMALARIEHVSPMGLETLPMGPGTLPADTPPVAPLTFVGVGNIGFSAASAQPMHPISKNGLVGHRLPDLLEFTLACRAGDIVVLYSDGISSRFMRQGGTPGLYSTWPWMSRNSGRSMRDPQALAQEILKRYGDEQDDASVVALLVTAN